MLIYMISVLLCSTLVSAQYPFYSGKKGAASEAQIRFAKENKYDDTGPGIKGPTYAYDTQKTLEDILPGYLDDPDTKLPEYEKLLAKRKLYTNQLSYDSNFKNVWNPLPSFLENRVRNTGVNVYSFPEKRLSLGDQTSLLERLKNDPFRVQKIKQVKISPLNLAHFAKDSQPELINSPQYSYSYGVHDKLTGDSKSAHESRDGVGVVTGFYTIVDANGQQRTVHYTADDKKGFRASVHNEPNKRFN